MIFILQKIPRCALPDDFAQHGPITVRYHPHVSEVGKYEVLRKDDKRVQISCWRKIIKKVGWKINTKIVALFFGTKIETQNGIETPQNGTDTMAWLFIHPLDTWEYPKKRRRNGI